MKKVLSILLSIILIISICPLGTFEFIASAATYSGSCGDNVTWSYNTSTNTLTISGTGAMDVYDFDYAAPWESYHNVMKTLIIGSGVTSIGNYAFYGCYGLTSVTIGNSVTSIGYRAFEDCTGLTSIEIPDSVTSIGDEAFYGTAWYNNQPDGLVYAGKVAYKYKGTCPANVIIKDGTLGIAGSAFYNCTGLTSITIPDSVTSIGGWAFWGCTGLTNITIPDSVTSIDSFAFCGCSGLTSITIPDSVTYIGRHAFSYCTGLTSITIPDSVTSIDSYAFYNCTGLTSITIPDSVTYIDGSAFEDCTIKNIIISEGSKTVTSTMVVCKGTLESVTIPDSVTSIGNEAFSYCTGLTSITIPDSVTSIGDDAFYGCTWLKTAGPIGGGYDCEFGWTDIIPNNAFRNCTGLTSITIPDSVTSIDYGAFSGCTGLTSVTIGNGVTSIDSYAFSGCSGLTSITIPDSVTSIGWYAFDGCTGLKDVYYAGTEQKKAGISIGSYNSSILNAVWHHYSTINAKNATCTEPGYTGDTTGWFEDGIIISHGEEIPPLGHDYKSVITPPTCTAKGYTTYTCTRCKDSYKDDETAALGHAFGKWCVTKAPTCTAKGEETRVCSHNNSHIETREIAALGHKPGEAVTEDEKAATCTETGSYESIVYCTVCKVELSRKTETVAKLGHDYKAIVTKPTCTAKGYTTHTCSRCRDNYKSDYTAALGHDYKAVITPSTCTEQGYTTHTCSRCGDFYKDEYTYMPCGDNCGFIIKDNILYIHGTGDTDNYKTQTFVPWYDYSDSITEIVIDEGITKAGNYAFYCLNNLKSIKSKNNNLVFGKFALNDSNADIAVFAENGGNIETYCTENNIKYIDPTITPEVESITANNITVKAVEGYEYSLDSTIWQKSNEFIALSPASKYTIYARYAATADIFDTVGTPLNVTTLKSTVAVPDAPDYQSHTDNSIILAPNDLYEYSMDGENWQKSSKFTGLSKNTIYRFYQRIAETETEYTSAPSAALITAIPDKPEILEAGYENILLKKIDGFEYCLDDFIWQDSNSFDKLIDNTEYYVYQRIKAIDGEKVYQITSDYTAVTTDNTISHIHNFCEWSVTTKPTCAGKGTEIGVCTECGQEAAKDIAALGHDYKAVITDPTCAAQGFTTYTCSRCGDSYVDDYTEPTSHTLGEWLKDIENHWHICENCEGVFDKAIHTYDTVTTKPTCTEKGYTTYTCTVCGYSYVADYTNALNHPHTEIRNAKAANCTETGYTGDTYCLSCGVKVATGETIAKLGHDYKAVVTAPTCTAQGYTTHTCSRCGDSYVDNYTEPTSHTLGEWLKDIENHWHICENCEGVFDKAIHTYDTVTTKPTCTEKGYTTYTCTVCGYSYVADYTNALNHPHTEIRNAKAATCTEDGYTGDTYCLDCSEKIADGETIKALGHDYKAVVTKPTCTAKGYTTYTCTRCKNSYKGNETAATGHKKAAAVKENEKKATYTKAGSYDSVVYCSACKAELSRTKVTVPMKVGTFSVTYKLNGGKNNAKNPKTFKSNAAVTLKNPTKKGYNFAGWYTNAKFTGKKVTTIAKGTAKNVTLYAKWTKINYKITYYLNKGKNNSKNPKTYDVTKTFTLKNPTRKGYTFKGWYSDAKFKKKVTKISKGTTGALKLYAKWAKKK